MYYLYRIQAVLMKWRPQRPENACLLPPEGETLADATEWSGSCKPKKQ